MTLNTDLFRNWLPERNAEHKNLARGRARALVVVWSAHN